MVYRFIVGRRRRQVGLNGGMSCDRIAFGCVNTRLIIKPDVFVGSLAVAADGDAGKVDLFAGKRGAEE